jgi:thioredoxin reductase (NADPH)
VAERANHHQLIIIGSGPAGYTAALYAARANLHPLVLAGYTAGGQLMITSDVENYPGYPQGTEGPKMMQDFREQAERFGAQIIDIDVNEVDFSKRPFTLVTDEETYTADAVIVATGASAKWIGAPGEEKLRSRGVSACATCDGFFFRDKRLIVVGGGDTAMEEALFLTRYASKVTVVHRRDTLRASKVMQERAFKHPKIDRTPRSSRASWTWTPAATSACRTRSRPTPTSPASSRRAMSATAATARPSPPRATAARPPSTPSGGSKARA